MKLISPDRLKFQISSLTTYQHRYMRLMTFELSTIWPVEFQLELTILNSIVLILHFNTPIHLLTLVRGGPLLHIVTSSWENSF